MPDVKATIPAMNAGHKESYPWGDKRFFWAAILIAPFLTFLAYQSALNNDFVDWDDPLLVQDNPYIRSWGPASIKWMFTPFLADNWIPLTWISYSVDYFFGKLNPWVYHLHNLLLHCLNTAIVFLLSYRIFGLAGKESPRQENEAPVFWALPAAFLSALFFGLHPIHVESVAWASERKDLLSGFFFLLSLMAYLDYSTCAPAKRVWKYAVCLAFFILALMAKPMAISLPFVLLVLDGWPLKRLTGGFSKTLLEKAPFFALSFLSGWLTILVQSRSGALTAIEKLPLSFRVMNSFHSLIFYLWKMLVPVNLSALYPALAKESAFRLENLAAVLMVALAAMACIFYRKKFPFLTAAFLYYSITLAPVLGILQFGYQAAADRYTYLPSLAPFMVTAALAAIVLSNRLKLLAILTAFLALGLGMGSYRQAGIWNNSVSLWENVIKIHPENLEIAYTDLGGAYERAGRLEDSLKTYDRVLEMNPSNVLGHNGRGIILGKTGRIQEAEKEFEAAAALNPQFDIPHFNLWYIDYKSGRFKESVQEALTAARITPNLPKAYDMLGLSYESLKNYPEAVKAFQKAMSLEPDNQMIFRHLNSAVQKARSSGPAGRTGILGPGQQLKFKRLN